MNTLYSVIKGPLVTEKSAKGTMHRKYAFWVAKNANKVQIRQALEYIYKIQVQHVASAIIKGKFKRVKANQPGRTLDWKKAVVTLKPGHEIKFT